MSKYKDFSSLPPDEERSFVPFEKAAIENGKKAWRIAFVACAVFLAAVLALVFTTEPPKNKMAEDDLGSLRPADEAAGGGKAAPAAPAAPTAPAATGEAAAEGNAEPAAEGSGEAPAAEGSGEAAAEGE